MSSLKSYLKTYFIIVAVLLLAIASFNFVVDPYNIFRRIEIKGFNQEKPYLDERGLSRVKALDLVEGDYDTVILGTSRVFWGLDPENTVFGSRNVYNAGLKSVSSYQIYKVFDYALRNLPLKTVVLGLDINAFDNRRPRILPEQDFRQSNFIPRYPLVDTLKTLLSLKSLITSVKTVEFNRQGKQTNKYTDRGFERPESFKVNRNRNFAIIAEKFRQDKVSTKFSFNRESMQFLIDIVEACDRNGIELKLFIEPNHEVAQEWEIRSGNLPAVEQWKRALVFIVQRYAPNNDGSIVLWDFGGLNTINTEKLPKDPQQTLNWYIDPVHYTKETGDIILDKLFNHTASAQSTHPDFGVMLTPANIDAHLMRLRASRTSNN